MGGGGGGSKKTTRFCSQERIQKILVGWGNTNMLNPKDAKSSLKNVFMFCGVFRKFFKEGASKFDIFSNWVSFFAVKFQTNARICSKNFGHLKIFSTRFLNKRFHQLTKSNVNNYCISQKQETSFENKPLIMPKPCKNLECLYKNDLFQNYFLSKTQ